MIRTEEQLKLFMSMTRLSWLQFNFQELRDSLHGLSLVISPLTALFPVTSDFSDDPRQLCCSSPAPQSHCVASTISLYLGLDSYFGICLLTFSYPVKKQGLGEKVNTDIIHGVQGTVLE